MEFVRNRGRLSNIHLRRPWRVQPRVESSPRTTKTPGTIPRVRLQSTLRNYDTQKLAKEDWTGGSAFEGRNEQMFSIARTLCCGDFGGLMQHADLLATNRDRQPQACSTA